MQILDVTTIPLTTPLDHDSFKLNPDIVHRNVAYVLFCLKSTEEFPGLYGHLRYNEVEKQLWTDKFLKLK